MNRDQSWRCVTGSVCLFGQMLGSLPKGFTSSNCFFFFFLYNGCELLKGTETFQSLSNKQYNTYHFNLPMRSLLESPLWGLLGAVKGKTVGLDEWRVWTEDEWNAMSLGWNVLWIGAPQVRLSVGALTRWDIVFCYLLCAAWEEQVRNQSCSVETCERLKI